MRVPVLLPSIFDNPFTYESNLKVTLKPGDYVKVPFGNKEFVGVVWNFEEKLKKEIQLKRIIKKINISGMKLNMIKFINWFSKYNMAPLGMSLKMTMINSGVVEKNYENEIKKFQLFKINKNIRLNENQKHSLSQLKKFGNHYNVSVLEGVTGSGKTIVYFERIKEIIKNGLQVLILLPEISLTDQFNFRLKDFFGYEQAIWHSKTTKKNKKIIWRGLIDNKIKLIVGARSSLFLPFAKLGLIVVDEEHDDSYKQSEGIRYSARDMAITRASIENIPIHLVTSIPSIETYKNIKTKKYNSTQLRKRYNEASFPEFETINLNTNLLKKGSWIAHKTIEKVKEHLNEGSQILFFLNRRGYSPFVTCKKCYIKFQCSNCAINLNYHKHMNKLLCHYCGFKTNLKRKCKDQKECDYLMFGPGVERIYSELKKIFNDKNIEIFSSDFLNKKILSIDLIKKIQNNKVDILIGTQMISKGFHFPRLNCVVVVDLDFTSHGYDIRAAEKNVQLYHQLTGRAGRENNRSKIYFQTHSPNDEMLLNIYNNDPKKFLEKEINLRKNKKLPPFFKLLAFIFSGNSENETRHFCINFKEKLPKIKNVDVLGPVNAPIYKLKGKLRFRILLRYPRDVFIQKYLKTFLKNLKVPPKIKLEVDVDPLTFH